MHTYHSFKIRHFILGDSTTDLTPEILLLMINGNQRRLGSMILYKASVLDLLHEVKYNA